MRNIYIPFFVLFFLLLSCKLYADVSFDSLKSYYNSKVVLQAKSSPTERSFLVEAKDLYADLESKENVDTHFLLEVLDFVAKSEHLKRYEEGLSILKRTLLLIPKNSNLQGFVFFRIGMLHKYKGEHISALENYLKSAVIFEDNSDEYGLAEAQLNISLINYDSGNNEIAIEYAEESRKNLGRYGIRNKQDSLFLALLYSIKGIAYRRLEQYDLALENTNARIEILETYQDSVMLAVSLGNKAVIFFEKGDYKAAQPLLKQDYETSLRNGLYNSAFNAGVILCKIYLKTDQKQKLYELFDNLQTMRKDSSIVFSNGQLLEYYKMASEFYETQGNESLTKVYLSKYVSMDHQIDSLRKINDLGRLQEKYLMEREITKLELLQKTNELQASHLKLRTAFLLIIGFVLLVVLWYVYVLRSKNKKIDKLNELLEAKVSERTTRLLEINKELDNYLYRASHDIRRPIRTLLGLNNVMKFTDDPDELKLLFSKVHDTAMNMDEMLFKLQMAYELNNDHALEEVDIQEVINSSLDSQKRLINYEHAQINVNVSKKANSLTANSALIKIAIDNILENAMIYHRNDVHPEIDITTDIGKYYFYIHIQDNGYGIDESYFDKIFESYFKISNKTQGSGLGLFLAHRAISFLSGEIVVESIINEGTKFTIKLPINPK